ncbi:DUF4913 domain-containing protein [Micromonospora sp. CPCC 206061]|uniref:DUF4913 domain-containing protein n=1 Tax=Micromonospora sp. CPCC 206061 TaxID=3122410 RepID=UPI002FF0B81F
MTEPSPDFAALLQEWQDDYEPRLKRVENAVEELDLLLSQPRPPTATPAPSPAGEAASGIPIELRYPTLEQWVVEHFVRVYARPVGGQIRWCARWWEHAEAITRLEALWRSWETLRIEPLGLDAWLRERLDHHLPHLLGPSGPFASCNPERHAGGKDLATVPAPEGWWDPPEMADR